MKIWFRKSGIIRPLLWTFHIHHHSPAAETALLFTPASSCPRPCPCSWRAPWCWGRRRPPRVSWCRTWASRTSSSVRRSSGWAAWRQLHKIGLPGKLILGDYFQENMTSRRPFLLLRISFPGRPIFMQFIPGANCTKIGLPGKSILWDYFQENWTSQSHFLLLRISFPGRPYFIQLPPGPPPGGDQEEQEELQHSERKVSILLKIVSENQFSGKTYFYAIHPWPLSSHSRLTSVKLPDLEGLMEYFFPLWVTSMSVFGGIILSGHFLCTGRGVRSAIGLGWLRFGMFHHHDV